MDNDFRRRPRQSMDFVKPSRAARPRRPLSRQPESRGVFSDSALSDASRRLIGGAPAPRFADKAPVVPKSRPGRHHKAKKQLTRKQKVKRTVLATLALIVLLVGWYGWGLLNSVNKVFHGNLVSDVHALVATTKLKGEDQGRVNILFAGDSADRSDGGGGGDLTDSIMVVSIDTIHHTGFMLSIPRDTWVPIPTMGHQKINAAHEVTSFSQAGYPQGGMGQLEEILNDDFGIPIDYYALVNYSAFQDAVNAVGGITVTIQSSDPRGLYDPSRMSPGSRLPLIKLPNGPVNLDGQTALNLARARGDAWGSYGFAQSDFDRTQHQRQMLTALEQKATTVGVLSNPLKISQLFGALGKNVQTDLTIDDAVRIGQLSKSFNVNNLQSLALGTSGQNAMLASYVTSTGQDALIPKAGLDDFSGIRQYYQQLTSNNPVVKEAPSVVVINGSSVTGLARKEGTALQDKGFAMLSAATASTVYPNSTVVDLTNGQKPASKQILQQLFNTTAVTSTSASSEAAEASGYNADFVVIIGSSFSDTTAPASTNTTQ
jgi:polyisoprenyl-teichoic acid--peptidoglycan teichoic acid transferase